MRILLADDERDYVETLAERLQLRGFDTRVVYDGNEALRALENERPDVAVLDLLMPGLSGDAVLQRARTLYPGLPVILLTGHGGAGDDAEPGSGAGAFARMTKPLALDVLLETLYAAVRDAGGAERGTDA